MTTGAPAADDRFARDLLAWFDRHGRHDLPWQHPRSAYRVWISEVMLQQTQVRTVIGYFDRFVDALPSLRALAEAPLDRVLALWSGLGYYTRARNLHRAAQQCVEQHDGQLPRDLAQLSALPGIGRSTAAAILAQAFGDRHAILDGNVRRVLARYHAIGGWTGSSETQRLLWLHADAHTPVRRVADYTQAIMDLGAMVCVRGTPLCEACPLSANCRARKEGLTRVLPTPKPSRVIPERSTAMLLVHDANGRVLLERRPPTGVWASLWSLPEAPTPEDAIHALDSRLSIAATLERVNAPFVHVFSHYRLRISPVVLLAATRATRVGDGDGLDWFARDRLDEIGLPAPVRTLLQTHFKEFPSCEPSTA